VHGDQTGGTSRVDGHGGTSPVEEVGNTVGKDAAGTTRRSIFRNGLSIIVDDLGVVITHDTDIDSSRSLLERLESHTSRLDGFIDGLQEDTLLRIDGVSFSRLDIEELRVD
jgi:hypothetical protein